MEHSKRRNLNVALTLGLIIWLIAPVAGFATLVWRAQALELAPTERAWVDVQQNADSIRRDVGVALEWSPANSVYAPSWQGGVVQKLYVEAGQVVSSGDAVARIAGVKVRAFESEVPISGPVGLGATGPDAFAVEHILAESGYDVPQGKPISAATVRAIGLFADTIGVEDGFKQRQFDPGWVVYLPMHLTVGTVNVVVGAPAPAAGTAIFEGLPTLQSGRIIDSSLAETINQTDDFEVPQDLPPESGIAVPAEDELAIGNVVLDLSEDRESIAPSSLENLAGRVQNGAKAVLAQDSRPAHADEWVVPSSALFVTGTGAYCLEVRESPNNSETVLRAVSVLASQNGVSVVKGDFAMSDRIAVVAPKTAIRCE